MRDLREIDVGSWTGLPRQEVKKRFRDAYAQWKTCTGRGWEGGETYVEMGCRVLDALRRIARNHPSDEVLMVTHSGPIRTVCAHALGLDYATDRRAVPSVDQADCSAVIIADDTFRPADAEMQQYLGAGGKRP